MAIGKETSKVVVYLPKDVTEMIEKEAEEKGLSLSSYLRMVILEYAKKRQ